MFLQGLARKSVRESSRKLSWAERMLSVELGWPEAGDGAPSVARGPSKGRHIKF